jgi:hypothetical protein
MVMLLAMSTAEILVGIRLTERLTTGGRQKQSAGRTAGAITGKFYHCFKDMAARRERLGPDQ